MATLPTRQLVFTLEPTDCRGSSFIEFAVVLPLLMLIIFGVIQYSMIFSAQLAVRNAAAVAARYAVLGNPGGGPPNESAVILVAKDSVADSLDENHLTGTVVFDYPLSSGETATQVQLSYALDLILPFVVPGAAGGVLTVNADAVMR